MTPRCIKCINKTTTDVKRRYKVIKRGVHARYIKNKIVIPEFWCELHWVELGRPKPEKV